MRIFNSSKGQTSVTVPPSSEPLDPNKLFLLSALDLGKYVTIAEINEMEDLFNTESFSHYLITYASKRNNPFFFFLNIQ